MYSSLYLLVRLRIPTQLQPAVLSFAVLYSVRAGVTQVLRYACAGREITHESLSVLVKTTSRGISYCARARAQCQTVSDQIARRSKISRCSILAICP